MKAKSACKPRGLPLWQRWTNLLANPIDGASLAIFRIIFGSVMLWESYRFLWPGPGGCRLAGMFAPDQFHFPYHGLGWLHPLPLFGMQLVFAALGVAAVGMILGIWYRASAGVVFLTWNYFFFSDQAYYQNHYYLISLFAGILIFCPAAECFSLKRWLRKASPAAERTAGTIPFWPVFLLRAQSFCMYFFACIAKLDEDWLTGIPIRGGCSDLIEWLTNVGVATPLTGSQLAWLMAWAGLFFDLAIGPLLIARRTRPLAIGLVFAFHGLNEFMFDLAALPYLAAGTTLIFCEPDWPRRFVERLRLRSLPAPDLRWLWVGAAAIPIVGALLGWRSTAAAKVDAPRRPLGRLLPAMVILFLVLNALIPLRHLLIGGDPDWTEEGYRFSWRMMQRTHAAYHLQFRVLPTESPSTTENARGPRLQEHFKTAFVATDSQAAPWDKLPELVLIYEPCLGVRAIGNCPAGSEDSACRTRLAAQWEAATGRRVTIRATQSLDAALAATQERSAAAAGPAPDASWELLQRRLAGARKITALAQSTLHQRAELIDVCYLMLGDRGSDILRSELATTHPFAVQGQGEQSHFLVIDDPALQANDVLAGTLQIGPSHLPTPVLFDPARQRTRSWRALPQTMLCEDPGGVFVLWNHHRDLTDHQIRRMSSTAGMVHCYARHVAAQWQAEHGSRPQVFADSLVSHNKRPLQALVDPHVDLATASLSMFRHNTWIAPLAARGHTSPRSVSAMPSVAEEVLARYPHGVKQLTRTPLADGGERLQRWDESGRMVLSAEYLDGQLHGPQTKYRADGSRESQIEYRAGRRHGRSIAWHADGSVAFAAEYLADQLENTSQAVNDFNSDERTAIRPNEIRR